MDNASLTPTVRLVWLGTISTQDASQSYVKRVHIGTVNDVSLQWTLTNVLLEHIGTAFSAQVTQTLVLKALNGPETTVKRSKRNAQWVPITLEQPA